MPTNRDVELLQEQAKHNEARGFCSKDYDLRHEWRVIPRSGHTTYGKTKHTYYCIHCLKKVTR